MFMDCAELGGQTPEVGPEQNFEVEELWIYVAAGDLHGGNE